MDVLRNKSSGASTASNAKQPTDSKSGKSSLAEEKSKDRLQELLRKGQRATKDGRPHEALEFFRQALELDPESEYAETRIEKLQKKIKSLQQLKNLNNGWYERGDYVYLTPEAQFPYKTKASFYRQLLPHQQAGVAWLWSLWQKESGGVLGDDMGLGKTVQISSFLFGMFSQSYIQRALLIMPKSVMLNWERELKKWCPRTRVVLFHGTAEKRERSLEDILTQGGIVLTTYGTATNAVPQLTTNPYGEDGEEELTWDIIVLDEGHKIKDPTKKTSKAIRNIKGKTKILLSGTPIMNNLKELWALFDYTCDGQLLGDLKTFKTDFEQVIVAGTMRNANEVQKRRGFSVAEQLRRLIEPYFLRRDKNEVFKLNEEAPTPILPQMLEKMASPGAKAFSPSRAQLATPAKDLPASPVLKKLTITAKKNDFICWVYLTPIQVQLYQTFIEKEDALIKNIIAKHQSALPIIGILRKICDHPRLLSSDGLYQESLNLNQLGTDMNSLIEQSGKLQFMFELLANLKKDNHRVLIFSGSTKMLDIIQQLLSEHDYLFTRIDGTVTKLKDRENKIDEFNKNKDIFCFLLTTGVGGVGLNLTAADRVIIFDPAWNSLDDQAVDRAYRIGQTKNVVVYRLITCGTIEEKMYRKQVFKGGLSRQMTDAKQKQHSLFSKTELSDLFTFADPKVSETQKLIIDSLRQRGGDMSLLGPSQRRESLDAHTMFLNKMSTLYGISHHDQVFKLDNTQPPQETNEERDFALQSAKKLKNTVVPKDVVDYERTQQRDEFIEQSAQKVTKTKTVLPRGAKVMVIYDDEDEELVGAMTGLNLTGNKPKPPTTQTYEEYPVIDQSMDDDMPSSPTKFNKQSDSPSVSKVASPKPLSTPTSPVVVAEPEAEMSVATPEEDVAEEVPQSPAKSPVAPAKVSSVHASPVVAPPPQEIYDDYDEIIIEEDEDEETQDLSTADTSVLAESSSPARRSPKKSLGGSGFNRRKSLAFLADEAEEVDIGEEIQEIPDDEDDLDEGEDITNEDEDGPETEISAADLYDQDEEEVATQDDVSPSADDSDVERLDDDDEVDEKQLLIEKMATMTISENVPVSSAASSSSPSVSPAKPASAVPRKIDIEIEIEKTPPKRPMSRLKKKMIILDDDEEDEARIFDKEASPAPASAPAPARAKKQSKSTFIDLTEESEDERPPAKPITSKKKVSTRLSDVSLPPMTIVDDIPEGKDDNEYDFDDGFVVPDEEDEEEDQCDYDEEEEGSFVESDSEPEVEVRPKSKSVVDLKFVNEKHFVRERVVVAERLYAELNERVFGGRLPRDMALRWRKTSAVVGLFVWKRDKGVESFYITLSRNYLSNYQLLLDTLSHEMCHAATRLIDNDTDRSHHGAVWWKWARVCMAAYRGKISITVKCEEGFSGARERHLYGF